MSKHSNFSYTDLSLTGEARPFDGMAAGRFVDMWGRETVFLPEELPDYVRNTKLALASTMDANGQVVGFPIDQLNHEGGAAAGWIVDVDLSMGRDVIEFTPRWNNWGREKIGADEMRFFSPTIDVEKRVIIGGSLTNWPATRTSEHQILLRPVELSESIQTHSIAPLVTLGLVMQTMLSELKALLLGKTPEAGTEEGVVTLEDEIVQTTEVEAEVEVEPEAVETTEADTEEAAPETPVIAELASPVTIANAGAGEPVVDLTSDVVQVMIAERAEKRAAELMAQREHAGKVKSFAARLVGGTPERPVGLAIDASRVEAFLAALPEPLYPEAEAILTAAVDRAPVAYTEAGHSRVMTGTQQLPDAIKPTLKAWLSGGRSIEKFFELNAVELGNITDYNLIEFKE
jgi:hypothetical protein